MPIAADLKDRYPADWAEISLRIRRDRAGWRCEGVDADGARCGAVHGQPHPVNGKKVVITGAHLNHRPEDNREENVRALCARCHLAHDRSYHQLRRRARRGAPDLLESLT